MINSAEVREKIIITKMSNEKECLLHCILIARSTHLSTYLPTHLPTYLPTYLPMLPMLPMLPHTMFELYYTGFLKTWANPGLFFVYFRLFNRFRHATVRIQIDKSIDGVHGI